ncbi:MAG: hypothetical protein AAGI01_17525 [Myxococcota bacterium]
MTQQDYEGPQGTDGFIEEYYVPTMSVGSSFQAFIKPESAELTDEERAARARVMALFCHMSVLFGLPVFLIPMCSRDEPFVLHHAKVAALLYVLFYAALAVSVAVNPYAFWVMILAYLPAMIAVHHAAGGERAGLLALGPLAEALFFPLKVKPGARKQLPYDPRAVHRRLDHDPSVQDL